MTEQVAWSRLAHARAAHLLRDAGVDHVVVKGPATAALLGAEDRVSGDVDVLVRVSHEELARETLRRHGFRDAQAGMKAGELAAHSTEFDDGRGPQVDLHRTFPGFGLEGEELWRTLAPHVTTVEVAHVPVASFDVPAALVVLALTAARDGAGSRAEGDLRHALGRAEWPAAVAFAREVGARDGVRAGLGLVDEAFALSLGLPERVAPEWLVRRDSTSTLAARLDDLARLPWSGRLRLLGREALPSRSFMRVDYPGVPLPLAHARRWGRLARELPGAVRIVVRARR